MTTDVDLVKSQILIAAGEKLSSVITAAGDLSRTRHRVPHQCRASGDASRRRRARSPSSTFPGGTGVRVDTAAYAEGVIPPYYDSLIAKLDGAWHATAPKPSRACRARWRCSSSRAFTPAFRCTSASWRDPDFRAGNFDTKFMERFLAQQVKAFSPRRHGDMRITTETRRHREFLEPSGPRRNQGR